MKIRITGLPSKKKAPSLYGFGGNLGTNGADFTDGLTYFNVPTRHETNPNGGIPLGVAPDGLPNLVEGKEENKKGDGGEIKWNSLDYIFSDRLTPSEDLIAKWRLAKSFLKYTYADVVRKSPVVKEAEQRPNDPKSLDTLDKFLADVAEDQELTKKLKEAALMLEQLSQMSDDELMALGAQMSLQLEEAARQQEMELLTLLPDDYESLAQNASLENIQSAALMNQMAQQQGMVQPLMIGAEGGRLFAYGGEQPEVMEQMPLDIPQEQQPMSMEPQQEMMLQLPMLEPIPLEMPQEERKPAEEMSTKELNEALDEIIEYAKETKDRLLLREAKKVKRSGTREEKEAFVDDTFEEIEMAEEEAAAQELQAALETPLESLEVPQEQPVMMAEGGEIPEEEQQADVNVEQPLQSQDGEQLIQQLLRIGDQLGYGKDSEYTPLEVEDLLSKASLNGIDVSSLQSQSSELIAEMLTLLLQLVNNQQEVLQPVAPEAPLENLFGGGGHLPFEERTTIKINTNPNLNTASYEQPLVLDEIPDEKVITVNEGDTSEQQMQLAVERNKEGITLPETVVIGHRPRPRVLLSPLLFMALFPTDDEDIFANTRALIESTGKRPSEITSQELAQRAIALEENKRAERKKYYLQQLLGYDYPLYSYMANGGPIFAQGGSMSLDNNEGNHVFAGVPLDLFTSILPQASSFWNSLSPEVQAFLKEYGFTEDSNLLDLIDLYNTNEKFKNAVNKKKDDWRESTDFSSLYKNLSTPRYALNMLDSYNNVGGNVAFWNRLSPELLLILTNHGYSKDDDLKTLYAAVHRNKGNNDLARELKNSSIGMSTDSPAFDAYLDLLWDELDEFILTYQGSKNELSTTATPPATKETPVLEPKVELYTETTHLWNRLHPSLQLVLQNYGLDSHSSNDLINEKLRKNRQLRKEFRDITYSDGINTDNKFAGGALLRSDSGKSSEENYQAFLKKGRMETSKKETPKATKEHAERISPRIKRWAERNNISYKDNADLVNLWNAHNDAVKRWGKNYENLSREDLLIARTLDTNIKPAELLLNIARLKNINYLESHAKGYTPAKEIKPYPENLFSTTMPEGWDYSKNGPYTEGGWDFSTLYGNDGKVIMHSTDEMGNPIHSNGDETIGITYTGYEDYAKDHQGNYRYNGEDISREKLRELTQASKDAFIEQIKEDIKNNNGSTPALNMLWRLGAGTTKGAENLYFDDKGLIKSNWETLYRKHSTSGAVAQNHGWFKLNPREQTIYRLRNNDGTFTEVYGDNPADYSLYYKVDRNDELSKDGLTYYDLTPKNTKRNLIKMNGTTYQLPDDADMSYFTLDGDPEVTTLGPGSTNTDQYYNINTNPVNPTTNGKVRAPYSFIRAFRYLPFLNFPYLEGNSSYNEMADIARGLKYIKAPDHRLYLKYVPSDLLYRMNQILMAGDATRRGIAGLSNGNQGTLMANLALANSKNMQAIGEESLNTEKENWDRYKDVVTQHNQVDTAYDLLGLEADKANLSNNGIVADSRYKAANLKYTIEKGNNDSKAAWLADMASYANKLANNDEQWFWYGRFLDSGALAPGADSYFSRGTATPPYVLSSVGAKGGCLTIRRKRRNRLS